MSADLALRLVVLALAFAIAWFIVRRWERRLGRGGRVAPGVTIVVTPSCLICPETIDALRRAGPEMTLRVLDATVDDVRAYAVQAAPTVVVADVNGEIHIRRTGRSTISDASDIVAVARRVAVAA